GTPIPCRGTPNLADHASMARLSRPLVASILAITLGIAGCGSTLKADAPGPGVPRISDLQFVPEETTAGCRVQLRFRFEDRDGDIVRAVAEWTLQGGKGRPVATGLGDLPIARETFRSHGSGEATSMLTLDRPGVYWYAIQ